MISEGRKPHMKKLEPLLQRTTCRSWLDRQTTTSRGFITFAETITERFACYEPRAKLTLPQATNITSHSVIWTFPKFILSLILASRLAKLLNKRTPASAAWVCSTRGRSPSQTWPLLLASKEARFAL